MATFGPDALAIAVRLLSEEVSIDRDLVTVAAEDVRAVLARLAELEAGVQRAAAMLGTLNRTASAHSVAREILGQ